MATPSIAPWPRPGRGDTPAQRNMGGSGGPPLTVIRVQGKAQASPVSDGEAKGDPGGLDGSG